MRSNGRKTDSGTIDTRRQALLESAELLRDVRLEVDRELEPGNSRNHVFPVLYEPPQKNTAMMGGTKTSNQARLRLVPSDDLDLCNSCNLSAASPLGSAVLPCSMSLTEEAVSPTRLPISARVNPVPRSSEMRDAQEVIHSILRRTVETSQRLPVTEFRDNCAMPRPPEMPKNLDTIGARVRWWREHRGRSRADLAKKVGYKSASGLSDLELGLSHKSERLHLIAAELGLNPHYVQSGKGEPEASFPQEAPLPSDEWPFPAVPRTRLKKLSKVERGYLETELLKALADIEEERRNKTG